MNPRVLLSYSSSKISLYIGILYFSWMCSSKNIINNIHIIDKTTNKNTFHSSCFVNFAFLVIIKVVITITMSAAPTIRINLVSKSGGIIYSVLLYKI